MGYGLVDMPDHDPPVGTSKIENGVTLTWRGKRLGWWLARESAPSRLVTDSEARKDDSYDKARLLDTAKETVSGRGKNYGAPEYNFMRIANHWEMFLVNSKGCDAVKFSITPGDVAIMMALMKIARLENDPKHADSWIDLAGYAACGAEIETAGSKP